MVNSVEHWHVMLNHVPIVGIPLMIIPIGYALIRDERHTLGVALVTLAAIALITSVVMWTGEEAHDRFMMGPIAQYMDEPGEEWTHTHQRRADITAIAVYVLGGMSLLAVPLLIWKRRSCRAIAAVVLIGSLVCAGLTAWTADAGGKVRHPEFRPPPAEPAAEFLPDTATDADVFHKNPTSPA